MLMKLGFSVSREQQGAFLLTKKKRLGHEKEEADSLSESASFVFRKVS